ncbi:hypothetical protein ACLQ2Q_07380 [Microbacterium sp. DT81.1]|uniref:hypothetical protein n=1 Tax=Microbacterium sp. DT81.1 TaxID=3393413 RepID=UPI003CEA8EEF
MKKLLATAAVACFAVLGIAAPAQAAADPAQNQTSYWESYTVADDTCYKLELDGAVTTFTLDALPAGQTYTLLVLKAGPTNTVIANPTAGVAYPASTEKGLSHVIYCVSDSPYYPGT